VQEIRLEQLTQRLVALETGAGSGQQPAPSGASILTEIYLCDAWSAHEIHSRHAALACLFNDAPCPPFTSHGASITSQFLSCNDAAVEEGVSEARVVELMECA
jgi:hypothetical protein